MIVDLATAKAHLNVTFAADDMLITAKIASAQSFLESQLGYAIEETYGGEDQPEMPAALVEAVLQILAHLYENREGVLIGLSAQVLPMAVEDTIRSFRNWSF